MTSYRGLTEVRRKTELNNLALLHYIGKILIRLHYEKGYCYMDAS